MKNILFILYTYIVTRNWNKIGDIFLYIFFTIFFLGIAYNVFRIFKDFV